MKSNNDWFVYILECEDKTLYTGVSTDVQSRFDAHKRGEGAKYTKTHKPKKIVYTEMCADKQEAYKREYEIKQYPRQKKLALINK